MLYLLSSTVYEINMHYYNLSEDGDQWLFQHVLTVSCSQCYSLRKNVLAYIGLLILIFS